MNTIPLTFNQHLIQCTVIGGTELVEPSEKVLPITVVLLNRGARHYRTQIFHNLQSFRFKSIISIAQTGDDYELENLARTYPFVKFIVPQENVTAGDMINLAVGEAETEFALVLWNNISLEGSSLPVKLLEKFSVEKVLCQVPLVYGQAGQMLPMEMVPLWQNSAFKVEPRVCYHDKTKTLYPFDYLGLYHCEKFRQLGGFDYTIKNPYWQNLDFFVRAALWGEEARLASLFKMKYLDNAMCEDITPDSSYLRFYLKNIMPLFKADHAELPRQRFFAYLKRCPHNIFEALGEFATARAWIEKNKQKYKTDAKLLAEMWGEKL